MIRTASTVIRIEKHKLKAEELANKDLGEETIFNAVAMHCFQAVNAAIELGELIVSEKKLGFPAKYREIFELIFQAKLIEKETFESFKRLIFLRNLIAHEYYVIKEEEIREMIELLDSLDILIKLVKNGKK